MPPKRLLFVANRSIVDAIAAGISLVYLYKVEVQCDKFGWFFWECEIEKLGGVFELISKYWVLFGLILELFGSF